MTKLKDLLKETITWKNRKFGERLPTMKDYKEAHNKKEVNEINFEKVALPAKVKRFMGKFVESIKENDLNRMKRSAVLYRVIDAMGMTPETLMQDIQKIKKGLKKDK